MNLIEKARNERRQVQADKKRNNERVFVPKKAWHNLAENLCAEDPDWQRWLEKNKCTWARSITGAGYQLLESPGFCRVKSELEIYEDTVAWEEGDFADGGPVLLLNEQKWKCGDRVRVTIERLE